MKRLAVLLAIVITCGSATTASAVHRTMLLETFTNTSCGACSWNDPLVVEFMAKYGPALAVCVQYHTWWPSNQDPFYLLTPTEVTARRNYYDVRGVPMDFTDSGLASLWTDELDTLETRASDRLLTESPFALAVQHSVGGGQVNVTVTVNAVDAPPAGTLKLRVALIETEVHYTTPPGNNGEKDFYNSMRRMLPDAIGTPLTIGQGQQQVFQFSTPVVAQWNTANIRAVAWVQLEETKEVLQAGSSLAPPAYSFFFGTKDVPDIVPLDAMKTFTSVLTNRGTNPDSYVITETDSLPAGWSTSVCIGSTCYPPETTDFFTSLSPGAAKNVVLDVTPMVTPGTGKVTLRASRVGSPSTSWTRTFWVVSSGLTVLVVDTDYGNNFETWYTRALDAAQYSYAVWDRIAWGPLSAAQLSNFGLIVWNVDLVSPPMYPSDMEALGTFLGNGGRLFISGQDVGWAMCDSTSPDCTPQSRAWYAQYLGAHYVLNTEPDSARVTGVTGDPIGNGMSFSIAGGTGGSWQFSPDEIEPLVGASPILYYHPGHYAGIRYQNELYKVVYLAYGFQAQDSYASQDTLMRRALSWLGPFGSVDVPRGDGTPSAALAARAAPNPFGAATRISFVVGGGGAVPVSVVVYDLSGRRLRTLWQGASPPGARSLVWDGRDDGGHRSASGIYLARVCVGQERRTVKLVLTE